MPLADYLEDNEQKINGLVDSGAYFMRWWNDDSESPDDLYSYEFGHDKEQPQTANIIGISLLLVATILLLYKTKKET